MTKIDFILRQSATNRDQLTTLSDTQLEMAWSIARYDVKAAYRYCVMMDAKNQMKCPSCGKEFVNSYEQHDGSMAFVCASCSPRRKKNSEFPLPSLTLNPSDYHTVCTGKPICIDAQTAKHQAKKCKIINKVTGACVVRTLVMVGDRGYWQ
ncbi:hypothetical protein [Nostoc punctiforme]|uniref:Uncharacterized protein n=1 Tax=Nostoc punctiforme NIES-2108 TaxID=1356359 RepID=A0A367S1I5_NOSPU|nr:hypothetical protein [Nostoc punctiforme]RCJ41931.1 hypothetical protein A6769_38570 [Nostoc punctiforme NIES-2108]